MSERDHSIASSWAARLGLAAETLFGPGDRPASISHHVLLDGADGSFALSTEPVEGRQALDWAWSALLRHHVLIQGAQVIVHHVGSAEPPRSFESHKVDERLERFFDLLIEEKVRPQVDVVEHLMAMFRGHRTFCHEIGMDDQFVLASFLSLLRALSDSSKGSRPSLALPEALLRADPQYVEKFNADVSFNATEGRTLDLRLTLRHVSGSLFQEAHSELARDRFQRDLFILPRMEPGAASAESLGAYYTPPALARAVAEAASRPLAASRSLTVLDPACGSGSFLIEAALALRRSGHRAHIRLVGYDVSSRAIDMARFATAEAGIEEPLSFDLSVVDFLSHPIEECIADIVLMNPPFRGFGLLTVKEQAAVRTELGSLLRYRPDVSQAFVTKALRMVRGGGRLGALLPVGVLGSSFGADWRSSVMRKAQIELVATLGAYDMFRDAMVNVACVILAPGAETRKDTAMIWAEPSRHAAAAAMRAIRRWSNGNDRDHRGTGWSSYHMPADKLERRTSWAPTPNALGRLLPKLERAIRSRVGDIFSIELGIRSGSRELFVISEAQFSQLDQREQSTFRPIAEKDAIRNGRIAPRNFLFYPDRDMTVGEIRKLYPKYYGLVLASKNLDKDHVLKLARARRKTMSERKPRIVSRAFIGVGAFAVDASGDYVVVQGYSWKPKNVLNDSGASVLDLLSDYSFIFNSGIFMTFAREYSIIQAGGQIDAAKRFMDDIPLPNLGEIYQIRPDRVKASVRLRDIDRTRFPEIRELDRFAAAVYGLESGEWPTDPAR